MRPARIVSWRGCFFKGLVRLMSGPLSRSPDQCLVIFPHHRPARYLKARLAEDPDLAKPLILPRMVSFQDLTAELRRRLVDRPLARLDRAARPGLDQVGLVYEIVRDLRATGRGLLAELPLDWERFLPWGERLAALLEEFLRHGLDPDNLGHMKDEVPDFAAALLEHLGAIHEQYAARLLERGQTTRGLDCALIARDPERAAEILAGKKIFISGFYALSGAEDALFKRLWSGCGAEVVWHSDPALAGSGKAHWAVAEHAAWLKRWAMRAELVGPSGSGPEPAIRFHQGFDLHSQLAALAEELEAPAGRTAVVLPDAAALGPALHHLPKRDINISMGYPLDRSALYQLLENIMALQERRAESGAYERRDLAELLRHPYLKMLDSGTGQWLRPVFRLWEAELRNSEPMSDPLGWLPDYESEALAQVPAQEAEALRLEVVNRCLTEFEDLNSLKDLARAVEGLIRLLRDRGGDLWARYLIDAECLARLESDVLPELAASLMSRERLSSEVLFSMLRRLCAAQRVSFEPEPLTGLQVLGLLETRLLGFDKGVILDAREEKLPGAARHDPLLPDAMR
ncbi:MAG: PD-(D/E)XK nuclease family protein, partial [Desulfovibrionaceae bacterium]|nr:PD-(D/E)XK nuclease family protein [Desulfovibrionaceae bacterium]